MSAVQLSDCYTARSGPALFNGMQALVRLLLEQARLDREEGLNTRGLVSGYPGSPLGGLDLELGRAKRFLDEDGIVFQPGLNEELAATALWGSQHIGLYDNSAYDGVFGLWYGKGPGLDRSMDALRHANHGGVAPKGGMVIAVGDDPTGKSSTLAYQSDQTFQALGIPYFFPRRVEDIIPMGLKAFALSRYAGVCVGLKMVIDTADANVILDTAALRPEMITPEAVADVHVGRHDHASLREARLHQLRLPAVGQWQRRNPVNHPMGEAPQSRKLGIIAVGKAVMETRESFAILGLDSPQDHGIGLFSVAMPWPLDAGQIRAFADGYDEVMVIEEKRGLVEDQVAKILINSPNAPRLTGKTDPEGAALMPPFGELSPEVIISAIARRTAAMGINIAMGEAAPDLGNLPAVATRTPYYCAGCPHNSSTKLPDGEVVGMGIGCHSISGFLTPDHITNFTQMGGEGAFWIGRAPFSSHDHTLQNMGDGTYTHSGYLGVRAAVASGVNMTFKILYNDAVAMTGGQDAMGGSTPDAIARQMIAEGVAAVSVVGDDPDGTRKTGTWPEGTQFHHRRDLIQVQEDLSRVKGTTGLIYVQTCAAELRRRRKRGKIPDRPQRLVINEAVCEGCGDCAVKSNCVAVKPVSHPEGVKRQVDQSVCNKDYSCNEGFCPSFVSVTPKGGVAAITRPLLPATDAEGQPLPMPPRAKTGVSNIYIAGIGGTGVSTLSAVLVMAARLEGIHAQAMNLTGLSQKNGGVTSQVRMSPDVRLDERMVRLPPRSADVLIGCDAVVAAHDLALRCLHPDHSRAVINARVDPVGVAGVGAGHVVDDSLLMARFSAVMNPDHITRYNVAELAERLLGGTTTANVMLLGMAIQMGLVPVSIKAITEALTLNGVQVEQNLDALNWGRWLAHDHDLVMHAAGLAAENEPRLDAMPSPQAIDYFAEKLTAYHNLAYAEGFRAHMKAMAGGLTALPALDQDKLLRKAARAAYRVMAIKDEYEVARLMTAPAFKARLKAQFGDGVSMAYNLAPPMMGWLKNRNGTPRKFRFGGWMGTVFAVLARMKGLRGTPADVFGYGAERKREVAFRALSLERMRGIAHNATDAEAVDAVLEAVLSVRGYGYVKDASLTAAMATLDELKAAGDDRPAFQDNPKQQAS